MLAGGIRRAIVACSSFGIGSCLALAVASACSFNASGNSRGVGVLQEADDEVGHADDDDSSPEPEPEPEPGDDDATRTDDGSASADDRGDASDATEGGEEGSVLESGAHDEGDVTGEVDDGAEGTDDGPSDGTDDGSANGCPTEVFELYWAESADLGDPMQLSVAADAAEEPEVAVSSVAEEGTVTFALHFDCAGEYAIWGLVWDYYPGAYASDDPDSYYVGVGGPEPTWRYGCQTGYEDSGLSWQRLRALDDQPCDTTPLVIAVAGEGDIELTFRNREAGASSEIAGIAAIVISSDPEADPYELYAPY
jgi:hypothetical protein